MCNKKIICLLLIVTMAVCFSGCRHSPVLEDNVYTQDTGEITSEEITDFTDDANESEEDLPSTKQDQNDDDRNDQKQTEEYQTARQSNADDSNGSADQIVPSDSKDTNSSDGGMDRGPKNLTGRSNNDDQRQGNGQPESVSEDESSSSDQMSTELDNQETNLQTEPQTETEPELQEEPMIPENQSPEQPTGSGEATGSPNIEPTEKDVPRKTVTDGNGVEQSIPKDVFTVTATGDAAPLVEMIGGSGRLIATSADFTSENGLGYVLCSDVQSGSVQTWWGVDNEQNVQVITDDYFQELLRQSPDVCFDISTQSGFTSEQISQLSAYGIGYMPLPELSSISNIKRAAEIVANTMDVNSNIGADARSVALSYIDWIDQALNEVQSVSPEQVVKRMTDQGSISPGLDTCSFVYIGEWRNDITFYRRYEPSDNNDVKEFPWAPGGTGSGVAITEENNLMKHIKVITGCSSGVIIWPDGNRTLEDVFSGTYHGLGAAFPYCYSFGAPIYSDDLFNLFSGDQKYGFSGQNDNGWYGLGSMFFPAVIVADDATRNDILNSPQWQPGQTDGTAPSDIQGNYRVYVNPVGFRNWAEGGIDAPLEAYWLAARITGRVDENILYNRIQYFYESFFGVRLNNAQISTIINR